MQVAHIAAMCPKMLVRLADSVAWMFHAKVGIPLSFRSPQPFAIRVALKTPKTSSAEMTSRARTWLENNSSSST